MISVVIPIYNGKEYIKETVDSILAQSILGEVILIDDCSSDGSYDYIMKLYGGIPLVSILKNESNQGFCKTANRGIECAKSEFVLVMGQDDLLDETHCENMLSCMSDDVNMVFCDYDLIDGVGKVIDSTNHCAHRERMIEDLCRFNTIPSVGLIMKKSAVEKVGGYPENDDFPNYGEYHLWIRMALTGRVVFCGKTRPKYRRHQTNMTNSFGDRKTKIKLNRYFNTCRRQVIDNKKVSIKTKIYTLLFMGYYALKLHIFR